MNASNSKSKKIEEGSEELGEDEEGVNDTESLTLSCSTIVSIWISKYIIIWYYCQTHPTLKPKVDDYDFTTTTKTTTTATSNKRTKTTLIKFRYAWGNCHSDIVN